MLNFLQSLNKYKDYFWILALALVIFLPHIKQKLGISTLEKDYEKVNAQLNQILNKQEEVIENLNKQLKQTKCDNILLLKSVIRLQHEMALSNEMAFIQLKINPVELSATRNRIENVRIGILEDLKSYSRANECIF